MMTSGATTRRVIVWMLAIFAVSILAVAVCDFAVAETQNKHFSWSFFGFIALIMAVTYAVITGVVLVGAHSNSSKPFVSRLWRYNRSDRKLVLRALKSGTVVEDPELADLLRQEATRAVRLRYLIVVFVLVGAAQFAIIPTESSNLIGGIHAFTGCDFVLLAVWWVVYVRRAKRALVANGTRDVGAGESSA